VGIDGEPQVKGDWGFSGARIAGKSPEFYAPPNDTCMAARQ